jgi:hypothetical protein
MMNIDFPALYCTVVNPIYSPALTSTYLLIYSIPIRANKKLPFIEKYARPLGRHQLMLFGRKYEKGQEKKAEHAREKSTRIYKKKVKENKCV